MKPLADRVVIEKQVKETTTESGLFIPETARVGDGLGRGKVIAVGEGRILQTGEKVPVAVKVGDKVLYNPREAVEITLSDKTILVVISEANIFATE